MTFEGTVEALFVTPEAGAPMEPRDEVTAIEGKGLDGDRYALQTGKYSATKVGKRAVTLIEREAIDGAVNEEGITLDARETRRNIVTVGVALNHLVGKEFTVGEVLLRGFDLSEPCTYLEGLTRHGVRAALVHRGGLRCELVRGGTINPGAPTRPAP